MCTVYTQYNSTVLIACKTSVQTCPALVEITVNKEGVEVEVDVRDNADESNKGTVAQATTDTANDTTEEGVTKVRQR